MDREFGGGEPNPGRGRYGVVLRFGSHRKELSGGSQHTSNERCDQLATEAIKRGTLQPDHGFRSGKRSKRSIKQSKQPHAVSVAQDGISVASVRPSITATSVTAPSATTTTSATLYRPRKEGDHCQHCQTPMVKRRP